MLVDPNTPPAFFKLLQIKKFFTIIMVMAQKFYKHIILLPVLSKYLFLIRRTNQKTIKKGIMMFIFGTKIIRTNF